MWRHLWPVLQTTSVYWPYSRLWCVVCVLPLLLCCCVVQCCAAVVAVVLSPSLSEAICGNLIRCYQYNVGIFSRNNKTFRVSRVVYYWRSFVRGQLIYRQDGSTWRSNGSAQTPNIVRCTGNEFARQCDAKLVYKIEITGLSPISIKLWTDISPLV